MLALVVSGSMPANLMLYGMHDADDEDDYDYGYEHDYDYDHCV